MSWLDELESQVKKMRDEGADNEQIAKHYASNAKWLRQRLDNAKAVLRREYRAMFDHATFDFANRRLIGRGYVLQWATREYWDSPISYENQQTTQGIVLLYSVS